MKPEGGAPSAGWPARGRRSWAPIFMLEPGYCLHVPRAVAAADGRDGDAPPVRRHGRGGVAPPAEHGQPRQHGAGSPPGVHRAGRADQHGRPPQTATRRPCRGPVKLVLRARMGSGPVAAQVFRKEDDVAAGVHADHSRRARKLALETRAATLPWPPHRRDGGRGTLRRGASLIALMGARARTDLLAGLGGERLRLLGEGVDALPRLGGRLLPPRGTSRSRGA